MKSLDFELVRLWPSRPYSVGAGIQTSAKRKREACGFAFRHSRRCFQGLVGDIIVEDVFFDVRQADVLSFILLLL
jgi:hypothetical protein